MCLAGQCDHLGSNGVRAMHTRVRDSVPWTSWTTAWHSTYTRTSRAPGISDAASSRLKSDTLKLVFGVTIQGHSRLTMTGTHPISGVRKWMQVVGGSHSSHGLALS
ncbi:hypothetical protein PV05_06447 [Exophiala xenobiotica]|uniref:Uncharacterized protein n=1 Tax=Exophiala xenobiotica TaxID=348802 RepID=A0A0D2BNB4_9EURO|nr:uncharacterized protein PV05_06447 [Exophiala xenobiotica]KIW54056.1 hypothetical protein PV05_06447 [Exophiala xenobiotica]